MRIEKTKLVKFLKKINIDTITEAILDFGEDGLKVSALNAPNTIREDVILKKGSFMEYEAIGKIGLQDIHKVITILSKFGKEITVKTEGNLITLSEKNKSVSVDLIDTQFIKEVPASRELEFDENFTIDANELKKFISDISINSEPVLTITTAEKKVQLSNTGKFKFTTILDAPEAIGGTQVSFGAPFFLAVQNLTDSVLLSLKKDFPAKIFEKTDESIVTYIVAPRMEEE